MDFRYINTIENGMRGQFYLALDETLLNNINEGKSLPVFRLNRLSHPGVSVGYFQKVKDEVDIDLCKKLDIDIARRFVGGGALFQDKELEYTIIVSLDNNPFPDDMLKSYEVICNGIINGLKKLRINSYFKPWNDIMVDNKKISGNAQTRRNNCLMQQGTILVNVNPELMFSVLKVPNEKIKAKLIQDVRESVTSIRKEIGYDISYTDIGSAIFSGCKETWGFNFIKDTWTNEEELTTNETIQQLFGNDEWNFNN